jgi:hypothetical protein
MQEERMGKLGSGLCLLALAAGCPRSTAPRTDTPATTCVEPTAADSIGSATMEADGTIVMMLRAEGAGGMVGDAMFSYPPDHAEYQNVLDHLCGLEPGQTKPVPPWPEK